jgi:dienelactone hydrolase
MMRLVAFAVLLIVPASCLAQSANPTPSPPPSMTDQTIGVLRSKQVGSIILPEGAAPFPAVIVMHGCNGISGNTRVWARRLASWGYAALIVDSLGPRGFENVCGRGRDLPGRERAKDAFAAADYLRTRPDIDHEHIGVLGYSHGGWSALVAAAETVAAQNGGKPFAAVVAYYPYCPPTAFPLASDVQILTGDADDWSPVKRCTDMVSK